MKKETEMSVEKVVKQPKPKLMSIKLEKLHPFEDHPYKVLDDVSMTELVKSIKEYGLLNRIIVRPLEDKPDEYEIISGHRRVRDAELLEMKGVPAVIHFIDPVAAEVVKSVFKMCLEGKGNETIARILQEKQILVPMAYWQSKGLPRGGKKTQPNPYKWCKTTVSKILAQQEYCGDIINFKTCSKSFKNKTRYANPEDKWAIFKNVHEPIIDREVFEQVQKLIGKTRRRNPKPENWERNMFCDLLYCADCGQKLWFNIKHDKEDIPFFMCGNYHGNRGTCSSTHYLRADAIEQVVIWNFAAYPNACAMTKKALPCCLPIKPMRIFSKRKSTLRVNCKSVLFAVSR